MKDGRDVIGCMRSLLNELEDEDVGMDQEDVRRLRGAKMPHWLFEAINNILEGYHDREKAVGRADIPPLVRAEYERMNRIVDRSVEAVYFGCAADVQRVLLEDLIAGRGWNKSVVSGMFGERMYYRLKKQCYLYIAARLGLI